MNDKLVGERYNYEISEEVADDFSVGPKYWCFKVYRINTGERVYSELELSREEKMKRNYFIMSHPFIGMVSETFDQAFDKCLLIEESGIDSFYEKVLRENGYYEPA